MGLPADTITKNLLCSGIVDNIDSYLYYIDKLYKDNLLSGEELLNIFNSAKSIDVSFIEILSNSTGVEDFVHIFKRNWESILLKSIKGSSFGTPIFKLDNGIFDRMYEEGYISKKLAEKIFVDTMLKHLENKEKVYGSVRGMYDYMIIEIIIKNMEILDRKWQKMSIIVYISIMAVLLGILFVLPCLANNKNNKPFARDK